MSPSRPARRFEAVIFDFDYTLADSSLGAIECVTYALDRMDLPSRSAQAVRETIGLSLAATYERLTGITDGTRFDEFRSLFVERADQVMLPSIVLFDSVRPVVESLIDADMHLGIVSTKFRHRIEELLRREGLEDVFGVIVGGEDVTCPKPDPAGLQTAMTLLGSAPQHVLYVGDNTIDAETASRAGVSFVAVLSGVTSKEAFASFRPLAVIDDLTLLPGIALGISSSD